jgi:predicted amidophosphoribosyltransferase
MRCTYCQHDHWKRALICNVCGRALTLIRPKYGNLPRCGATFVEVVAHSGLGGWQPRPLVFYPSGLETRRLYPRRWADKILTFRGEGAPKRDRGLLA